MLSSASQLAQQVATLLGMELDLAEVQLHGEMVRISQKDGSLFEVECRHLRKPPKPVFEGNEDETICY